VILEASRITCDQGVTKRPNPRELTESRGDFIEDCIV
jgi:hypothetical protein